MSAQNDTQAAFMEAMNGLKEYAKVNGGFITKDDVLSYFKDLDLDDGKLQMVYGYLMANNIKIKGAASEDNEFLKMMETAEAEEIQKQEAEETKQEEQAGAKQLEESLDYAEDEKYLQLYLEDLKQVDMLSDTSLAFLLMNIVEDNDKNSLELLSQSFLGKVTNGLPRTGAKVCLPAIWCRKVIWQCCPISARSSGQTITNGKIRLKKEIRRICSKSFTALKKKSVNWLRAVLK